MSGSRPQHLQRRGDTYHLRVRVPDDLRMKIGRLEVRRSLGVHTSSAARILGAKYAARVMEVFDMVRVKQFTKEDARALVVACFRDLATEVGGGLICESSDPATEIAQQRHYSQEALSDLTFQAQSTEFSGSVRQRASELLGEQGRNLSQLRPEMQVALLSGVARALAECERLFLYRLDERLLPYVPDDPLFQIAVNSNASSAVLTGGDATARTGPIGPSVTDLVDHYLNAKRREWTSVTGCSRM
jgi:hypothetical protein